MTTTPDKIRRIAERLMVDPTDTEAAQAMCNTLLRRGHGPDAIALGVYNTGLLTRILMGMVTGQANQGQLNASVEGLVRSLKEDAVGAGVLDLVGPLITEHGVGVIRAVGEEVPEYGVDRGTFDFGSTAEPIQASTLRQRGAAMVCSPGPIAQVIFIDEAVQRGRLDVVVQGHADVHFVRNRGLASASWNLTLDMANGAAPDSPWEGGRPQDVRVMVDGVLCENEWVGVSEPSLTFTGSSFSILTPPDTRTHIHLERIE